MGNYTYLYDKNFLKEFDKERHKIQFTRITVLDFKTEQPLASIEGKATGGSCNFSGTSNMRRTGNCSLLVDPDGIKVAGYSQNREYYDITDVENLISMSKKIKLETGFLNNTNKYQHFSILWFPLGTYVIKTASTSKNNSGVNISLTLNDKCALLNGDMGGVIPAGTILSEQEENIVSTDGSYQKVTKKLLIKDIIRYIVTEFGGEDPANICIMDIPDTIVKVMKWIGKDPLYYLESTETGKGKYLLLGDNYKNNYTKIFSYGQDVCYLNEPFVYPGTLECSAGETVASVLDKIKNVLGNFEWFYDINGRFCFQEIKNYLNTSLANKALKTIEANDYQVIPNLESSVYTFDKEEKVLITSVSNTPQYQNIKNDFIVWGTSKTAVGVDKPIRYHLTLATKPKVNAEKRRLALVYTDYRGLDAVIMLKEGVNYEKLIGDTIDIKNLDKKKFYIKETGSSSNDDIEHFIYRWDEKMQGFREDKNYQLCLLSTDDWRTELFYQGLEADKQTFSQYPYAAELNAEWTKIYKVNNKQIGLNSYDASLEDIPVFTGAYRKDMNESNYEYWLDFIEGSPFSVDQIGYRTKVVDEKDANCIFPIELLDCIVIEANGNTEEARQLAQEKKQEAIQVSSKVFNNLTLGGSQNSLFEKIQNLLYLHTNYNESISLSTVPIYHLEPNTRITVRDKETCINGDYMIKSISIPLAANGTSNISATKIVEKTF